MSYKLIPLKDFKKFFKERTQKERDIIDQKLMILSDDPFSNSLDIKKLKGYDGRYRLRVGRYRVIYEIFDDVLVIVLADGGSRGGIYK